MAKAKAQAPAVRANSGAQEIEPGLLTTHLERVFLGGLVGECALICEGGSIFTTAIDPSNAVFVSIRTSLNLDYLGGIGFPQLVFVVKFLEMVKEKKLTVSKDGNRLVMKPDTGPSLRYLLGIPETIVSYEPTHAEVINTLFDQSIFEAPLPNEAVEGYLQMMGLLKLGLGKLTVNPGSEMILTGGLETEHQFVVGLGPAPADLDKAFDLMFAAEHLRAVLAVAKGEELTFRFGEGKPIIISVVGEESHWAIVPSME